MNTELLDKLLKKVEKPARYIGEELNAIKKTEAQLKFALCFPDIYEIGMSHLGSRILYNIINKREDALCERAYTPWRDMEDALRENGISLFSLENKRPLKEFDILGFSLLYEMSYTNILTMLDLSEIPFLAKERDESYPLIISGGPCACNPEPVADIMDAFLIGDGEELINDFLDVYLKQKSQNASKKDILHALSAVEGVYVPSLYIPQYGENGAFSGMVTVNEDIKPAVTRRVVKDLDSAEFVGELIVPYLPIVHDRVALELFRGCTRGCRFCQAGFIYRPVREKSMETVMRQADELIACTGYDEVSLFSLSSGDYSKIHELVPALIKANAQKKVSLTLPSLRIDSFIKEDLEQMQSVRKTGLTFAPEAGTQRLRDVINKGVTEEDLVRSVSDAFSSGWSGVKLYFMIGLPTETDEDILGIAKLVRRVSDEYYALPKEKRGKGLRISVSASTFVPKPFTPFQWEAQASKEEIIRKQKLLKSALFGIRGAEFSYHAPDISILEGVFARGDRRLCKTLIAAYKSGCRLDSWDEHFNNALWDKAFSDTEVDKAYYCSTERGTEVPLPWDHIDMLVTKKYLVNEYSHALTCKTTRDCRKGCNMCFGEKYADYCKV